ncbi:hypothetical protein [Methanolobus sp.]|uniref:hypothetical protein n=1 Tax=Methanolobus sp. TaxID=1874737 RepID=UPI0025CD3EAA|nr:hypothetical protein [Methanolobus sp.]
MGMFDFLKRPSSKESSQVIAEIIKDELPEHTGDQESPSPICPYCNTELEQMPKGKKKCPHCSNYIRVRKPMIGEEKVLMTEEEADDVAFVAEQLKGLEYYNITQDDYVNTRKHLKEEHGEKTGPVDVLWTMVKNLNDNAIEKKDIDTIRNTLWIMSLILYREGRDFIRLKQESEKMRLVKYRKEGVEMVKISSPGPCEACAKNNGKVLTIDEALETMPIPNPDCTTKTRDGPSGWCRCRYVVFFDDAELDK